MLRKLQELDRGAWRPINQGRLAVRPLILCAGQPLIKKKGRYSTSRCTEAAEVATVARWKPPGKRGALSA